MMGYEEGRRAPRTPQLYHREPSFRKIQSSSALPGLPYWVRRQGWVGAVVGAFLFGIIICLVFTMGTVVKPETAMMPVVQRRPLPTQDLETSLSERLRKLEEEKARVAEAAKYDKAEADRLRNIIERDHDKDSPQQLALQKRIGRLEQVIRSQEQRDTVPKTSDQPTTPIPTKLHQTIRFEDGVTVIAKADVRVGNSDQIIVQKGSLGIVLKSNSDFKTKVQFMGAYGTKNPVVIFVKSEELQRATLKDLQEDRLRNSQKPNQIQVGSNVTTESINAKSSKSVLVKEEIKIITPNTTIPPLPKKSLSESKGQWKQLNNITENASLDIAAKEVANAVKEKEDWNIDASMSDTGVHPPPRKRDHKEMSSEDNHNSSSISD